MRIWASIGAIVLAIITLSINLGMPASARPADFRNGAYRCLLAAEKAFSDGRAGEAVGHFRMALMRAYRCGRRGVAERVKVRLATAGVEIADTDLDSAFCLLSAYALVSQDFDTSADNVESFVLLKSRGKITSFEYPLILEGGGRTFWLEPPTVAPVFIYRMFEDELELRKVPGRLTYLKAGELPPGYRFSHCYSLPIGSPKKFRESELSIVSGESENLGLVLGTNGSARYHYSVDSIFSVKKGRTVLEMKGSSRYFCFNSIIFFSDQMDGKDVKIDLVRTYRLM